MTGLRAVLGAAILAAAACGSTATSPSDGTLRVTVTQNPTFTADSLSFTMQVENISRNVVDLTFPSSCEVLPFFTDRAGREIVPVGGGLVCATVITRRSLAAGEKLNRSVDVKAGTAADGVFAVFPPGDYNLSARLMDTRFKLQSAPMPFSVR